MAINGHEGIEARRHEGLNLFVPLAMAMALVVGCGKPNKANIELRKQNADLRSQVDTLKRQHEGDAASLAAMETKGSTTRPSLASEQLSQLFTVHGIELGKLISDPKNDGLARAFANRSMGRRFRRI